MHACEVLRVVRILGNGATISKYQKDGATLSKGWVRQLVKGGATFIRTLHERVGRREDVGSTMVYVAAKTSSIVIGKLAALTRICSRPVLMRRHDDKAWSES
jgi:hypothetical protein